MAEIRTRVRPPPGLDATRKRGLDVRTHTAYITVRRQLFGGPEEVTEEKLVVMKDPVEMVRVGVGISFTKNLGDFQSAKHSVSINWPCLPDETEVSRCYEHISHMAEDMLIKEIDKHA